MTKLRQILITFFNKTKKDVRICLHTSKKSNHHDMIILQKKNNFYPPINIYEGETYHIIKGSMVCILFNDAGKISKIFKLKKNDIFRTPINVYHTMSPISQYVVYHESKTGPFLKRGDSIFPNWIKSEEKRKILIEKIKNIVKKTK